MQISINQTTFPDYASRLFLNPVELLEIESNYIHFRANDGKEYDLEPDKSGFHNPDGSSKPMNLFQNVCQEKFPNDEYYEQYTTEPSFFEHCIKQLTEADYFEYINARKVRWSEG